MSVHKLTGGSGYDYLTRQVEALDATEKGHTGLAAQWKTVAENGEIVADSAEGHQHQGYAITMAKKLNPGAELVIDDDSED